MYNKDIVDLDGKGELEGWCLDTGLDICCGIFPYKLREAHSISRQVPKFVS